MHANFQVQSYCTHSIPFPIHRKSTTGQRTYGKNDKKKSKINIVLVSYDFILHTHILNIAHQLTCGKNDKVESKVYSEHKYISDRLCFGAHRSNERETTYRRHTSDVAAGTKIQSKQRKKYIEQRGIQNTLIAAERKAHNKQGNQQFIFFFGV